MSSDAEPKFTPEQLTLSETIREIEAHVAKGGWDAPPRIFALVRTAQALQTTPELAQQLPDVVASAQRDPNHLLSIEQEDLPPAESLEELLGSLSWPDSVHGAAVVVERMILAPEAEENIPADPDEAMTYLLTHPGRQEVRLAVAALRDGPNWCAIRGRQNDDDNSVGLGPDLVPGLVEAIRSTLE